MRSTFKITFGGEELLLDAAGAIIWPRQNTLIVSDLHLEKASFLSQFGIVLPRYDTRATLAKLANLFAYYKPDHVICLGDSFHDAKAFDRLDSTDRLLLFDLIAQRPHWYWVLGNHDPSLPTGIPGEQHTTLTLADILFSHEPEATDAPQIIGHFHPKLSMSLGGHHVSGPAFVQDESLIIMPAFGSFTGGLNTRDKAIASLVVNPAHYMLYRERIWKL